jgi:FG-GAP-like repeat
MTMCSRLRLLILIFCSVFVFAGPAALSAAAAQPVFAGFTEPITLPIGRRPQDVVAGDMNGDGFVDLVIGHAIGINGGPNKVTVLLSNGDGTFQEPLNATGPNPVLGLAIGDLDGDGDLDAMCACPAVLAPAGADVFLNDGTGQLILSGIFTAGASPADIDLGDLNSDSLLDAVVTSQLGSDAFVLIGVGDGTFLPAVSYPVGNVPTGVDVGDLDGDGDLDFVVSGGFTDDVTIRWNDGSGVFTESLTIAEGVFAPSQVRVVDVDGDGDQDIVVGFSGGLRLILNTPDGFKLGAILPIIVGLGGTGTIVADDINNDGTLDLIGEFIPAEAVKVILRVPGGKFVSGGVFTVGNLPRGVTAADLDSDGDLDLAVTNQNLDTISILFNQTISPTLKNADLNSDGFINAIDLAQLLAMWGQPGPADLNYSGATNSADLVQMLAKWR